jgi:hypothetical protein
MTVSQPKIAVRTPTEQIPVGRGFYQLEEDSLYVQVAPWDREHRFFSFLESDQVRLDIDKNGVLLFIEVTLPRRNWETVALLEIPTQHQPGDVRWADFRQQMVSPRLVADRTREHLRIIFSESQSVATYEIAQSILVQADDDNLVTGIWIADILDDLAGQEIAHFRNAMQAAKKSGH